MLARIGVPVVTVDLGTSGGVVGPGVRAADVAASHPDGAERRVHRRSRQAWPPWRWRSNGSCLSRATSARCSASADQAGRRSITPAMRALPIGVPKLMVSTMASGNVAPYVGSVDITMMYSVTDVAGLNRISRRVLANAAGAIAGAYREATEPRSADDRPAVGITMFGVTTPCVQQVMRLLGGRSRLSRLSCDRHRRALDGEAARQRSARGGAGSDDDRGLRFPLRRRAGVYRGSVRRRRSHPGAYVGSCGALDMVNFAAMDTVPDRTADAICTRTIRR